VLVAGDAAGLLDPWLREGISFALRSGALAGRAAAQIAADGEPENIAAAGQQYADSIDRGMAVEMAASEQVSAIFASRPELVHNVLTRVPLAWRKVDGYLTGAATIPEIIGHPLVRFLMAVARVVTRRGSSPAQPRRGGW
jgi:flavin-dependent dehydrogenase